MVRSYRIYILASSPSLCFNIKYPYCVCDVIPPLRSSLDYHLHMFFLSDPSPATIEKLDSPPKSFINEGQNARFHCTVSGSPRPNVTWKRGQEIVAFCAGKYNSACKTFKSRYKANWRDDRGCMRNHSMGPTSGGWVSWLNVNNLQYPADVKYTCEVENSLGNEEKVASLKIAGKLKNQFHFHIISFILFHSIL